MVVDDDFSDENIVSKTVIPTLNRDPSPLGRHAKFWDMDCRSSWQ